MGVGSGEGDGVGYMVASGVGDGVGSGVAAEAATGTTGEFDTGSGPPEDKNRLKIKVMDAMANTESNIRPRRG